MALNRFYNLERRLVKDTELYDAYRVFMDEYSALEQMNLTSDAGKYFILHHAVAQRGKIGLKIRVIFDTSVPSSSGLSLKMALSYRPKLV